MSSSTTYTFRATCAFGYEAALAAELKALGLTHVQTQVGFVAFEGVLQAGYRAMINSRLASRILVVLARFSGQSAQSLYEDARRFNWEEHLGDQSSFSLQVNGTNSELRNTSFTALKIKDAIHDQYRHHNVQPPSLMAKSELTFVVQVRAKYVTLMVDITGDPLIYRSYDLQEEHKTPAHLYALLLQKGGWYRCIRHNHPVLICPTITSPVLAIEAAQQVIANAPGLSRSFWAYDAWGPAHRDEHQSFSAELDKADACLAEGESCQATIVVAIDRLALHEAEQMARRAGVLHLITFVDHELSANEIAEVLRKQSARVGLVIFDYTYANIMSSSAAWRLSNMPEYRGLPLLNICPDYTCVTLELGEFDDRGCLALKRGKETMTLRVFDSLVDLCHIDTPHLPAHEVIEEGSEHARSNQGLLSSFNREGYPDILLLLASSEQFAGRLIKRRKHLGKWARREGVTCYRLYDADLPDYNLAIDLYTSEQGKRALQIFEYAPPQEIDKRLASARLIDAAHIAASVLEVEPQQVYIKQRHRGKGGSQYAHDVRGTASYKPYELHRLSTMVVLEQGRRYVVNHTDYLDTGIFLDTRNVRNEIERLAAGKRFLNLFAYTGTATVAAVRGGARQSVTVDISSTYLRWAEHNLTINGLHGRHHRFVRADVLAWIKEAKHSTQRFDLIYVDPPTFSNSSRMKRTKFAVQEDHLELLTNVSRLLAVGGTAIFVTNDRRFEPNVEKLRSASVMIEDVSKSFLPQDFERNDKIHKTYLVRRIPS